MLGAVFATPEAEESNLRNLAKNCLASAGRLECQKIGIWGTGESQMMHHYFFKLIPPRATFSTDMTDHERALMESHVAYWTRQCERGRVVVFGPVADPHGGYGIAVIRANTAADAHALVDNDPTLLAKLGFKAELNFMPVAMCQS